MIELVKKDIEEYQINEIKIGILNNKLICNEINGVLECQNTSLCSNCNLETFCPDYTDLIYFKEIFPEIF